MKEKVLLAIVDYKRSKDGWPLDDAAQEMKELVAACGGEVVEQVFCRIDKPAPAYLIGEGKVKEIAELCAAQNLDTVIFNQDLKGNQQRNIEEIVKVKTIDRTQLILDIFARRAASQEGKMQVELAQLEYLLPRLVGKGVEMSRLGGGIGTLGPGETKLEVDRRKISERISRLKKNLREVAADRTLKRKKRQEQGIPLLSLVGYTNAGKSTLLNRLTQADQKVENALFTTLDSLSRQYILPSHQKIIISDTVGFIHDLPHHLVESFKATLEEVKEADLLLHVVDVSHPQFKNFYESVIDVLRQLEVQDKPTLVVLNKIDRLEDKKWLKDLRENFDFAVAISALTGEGIEDLTDGISKLLSPKMAEIDVLIPINRMDLVSLAHEEGQVIAVKYYNDTINIRAILPVHIAGKFEDVK